MHPLVCHIIIIAALICLMWLALRPSRKTRDQANELVMRAYMELLKNIRSCNNREHLKYINGQITEFENKFQGRVYDEILALFVNDLGWEVTHRKSEL